ncbi:hypothetical protein [Inquilinus sp. CAU 1745]|uniref:hypothetical protein n=1 Tax=Inquilinus sp. CAU 1745 TaxID=3140369 RepID=UPI00325C3108
MALNIQTFSNVTGGSTYFKALGHPLAAEAGRALARRLSEDGSVAVYDPNDMLEGFAAFFDLSGFRPAGVFVQDIEKIGSERLGLKARPVTELSGSGARTIFVVAFDADRLTAQIRHLIPEGTEVVTLDAMRLPDEMLTNRRAYLVPLNFATNFAFFRDGDGHHSRVVTANYWSMYGAKDPKAWLCLFDEAGSVVGTWTEELPGPAGTVVFDSAEIAAKLGLDRPVTGQMFVHIIGAAGHDIVKYALDTYGDSDDVLSCTHDANAWPADLYAGLPAPKEGEQVILWVQNSHPCPIPRGGVGLNLMGSPEISWLDREIPPFGTYALSAADLLPDARWPQQIEIQAGKHFVRPRYEVVTAPNGTAGRRRMAHVNVERIDLKPDPSIAEIGNLMGKGFLLPAPILPADRFRSIALPTPMSTAQANLPLAAIVYDAGGREMLHRPLGKLDRAQSVAFDAAELLEDVGAALPSGFGHMELIYDFAEGGEADGWLHGLFRYEDMKSGHAAETSFGAHIFNTALVYKNEPQSYAGRPPGLTTRLFLRLGVNGHDTICHLIYAASTPWHATSDTHLILHDREGTEIASRAVAIPCSGSHFFKVSETFEKDELARAGDHAYVIVRDTTCRLFGYHGLMNGDVSFSLDHMFGF